MTLDSYFKKQCTDSWKWQYPYIYVANNSCLILYILSSNVLLNT
jgi:hypothetical protein